MSSTMEPRYEDCHLSAELRQFGAQISLETKDVFIECTATDLTKAQIVLHTVTTMFSEYCSTPFEVEPVEVVDALGQLRGMGGPPLRLCQPPVWMLKHQRTCAATGLFLSSRFGCSVPGLIQQRYGSQRGASESLHRCQLGRRAGTRERGAASRCAALSACGMLCSDDLDKPYARCFCMAVKRL
jgi:hypothetical protein